MALESHTKACSNGCIYTYSKAHANAGTHVCSRQHIHAYAYMEAHDDTREHTRRPTCEWATPEAV